MRSKMTHQSEQQAMINRWHSHSMRTKLQAVE
jgi:hypothetical protein